MESGAAKFEAAFAPVYGKCGTGNANQPGSSDVGPCCGAGADAAGGISFRKTLPAVEP